MVEYIKPSSSRDLIDSLEIQDIKKYIYIIYKVTDSSKNKGYMLQGREREREVTWSSPQETLAAVKVHPCVSPFPVHCI